MDEVGGQGGGGGGEQLGGRRGIERDTAGLGNRACRPRGGGQARKTGRLLASATVDPLPRQDCFHPLPLPPSPRPPSLSPLPPPHHSSSTPTPPTQPLSHPNASLSLPRRSLNPHLVRPQTSSLPNLGPQLTLPPCAPFHPCDFHSPPSLLPTLSPVKHAVSTLFPAYPSPFDARQTPPTMPVPQEPAAPAYRTKNFRGNAVSSSSLPCFPDSPPSDATSVLILSLFLQRALGKKDHPEGSSNYTMSVFFSPSLPDVPASSFADFLPFFRFDRMQGFEWFTEGGGKYYNFIKSKAQELGDAGITAIWLPVGSSFFLLPPCLDSPFLSQLNTNLAFPLYSLPRRDRTTTIPCVIGSLSPSSSLH